MDLAYPPSNFEHQKKGTNYEHDDGLDEGNVRNNDHELEYEEEEEAEEKNKERKRKNEEEDNNDGYGDKYGFNNLLDESVGGVKQKDKGPSGGDNEDESDEGKMKGGASNKRSRRDENLEESDSDLDEDSLNDMLAQVVNTKASSSSTGQMVYVSHSMLTKDKSEHKALIIWDPKLNWIFVPKILVVLS